MFTFFDHQPNLKAILSTTFSSQSPNELRRAKYFFAMPTKNDGFFTAGNWEKDTVFGGHLKLIFGPSYSIRAIIQKTIVKLSSYKFLRNFLNSWFPFLKRLENNPFLANFNNNPWPKVQNKCFYQSPHYQERYTWFEFPGLDCLNKLLAITIFNHWYALL